MLKVNWCPNVNCLEINKCVLTCISMFKVIDILYKQIDKTGLLGGQRKTVRSVGISSELVFAF